MHQWVSENDNQKSVVAYDTHKRYGMRSFAANGSSFQNSIIVKTILTQSAYMSVFASLGFLEYNGDHKKFIAS